MDVFLSAMGVVCSLGSGESRVRAGLFGAHAQPPGLSSSDAFSPGKVLPLGIVNETLPVTDDWPLRHRSRANALADVALAQIRAPVAEAIDHHGADRVAVVIGGSTSGLREGESAVQQRRSTGRWPAGYTYAQQELGATADFVAWRLGARGPAYVVSSACSSGARALASAARLLRAGIADAVVAGGADALCRFTVAGFSALESVSAMRTNPMSEARNGINLGEGAAMFLLQREPAAVRLAGWGEASEAYHMSAPTPDGRGAIAVMRQALARAGIDPATVDYINLHGTATVQNDAMEALAVTAVFGLDVPVSSTKPMTGHALGAAGAIEAAFCWLTLVDNPQGWLPVHWWDGQRDPALPRLRLVSCGDKLGQTPRCVMSNSFAFGGSNASLLLCRD